MNRLQWYLSILREDFSGKALGHYNSLQSLISRINPYINTLTQKHVLDIGCGPLFPMPLLLSSLGNNVIGIDLQYFGNNDVLFKRYYKQFRFNGLEYFGRALLYDLLRQKHTYYAALQKFCDFPLVFKGMQIERMNAANMTFKDDTFDLIVSFLCFEHIVNVQQTIEEMYRVLKNGGLAYVDIHLFSSRTGHHLHPGQMNSKFDEEFPWIHLYQPQLHLPIYLNKLRENDYLSLFRKQFSILNLYRSVDEDGRKLLTPELQSLLSDYSENELLTYTITILAQKPCPSYT